MGTTKLELRDVMEDCSHIMLQDTKDGQTRRVPLLKRSADIMHERKERGLHMLFEGFSGAKLRNNYKKMRTEIGYKDDPEFIPHLMCHTCTTLLAMNNTPDRKPVAEKANELWGLYGDKVYISGSLEQELANKGVILNTGIKNMKPKVMKILDRLML
uniref:transposase n=1 Tax=Candidatus Enterovibrio escicola TaxID=1927127 RepID=UPI001237A3AC|nr:transposase [Candidatus Enterovibrio escacola]